MEKKTIHIIGSEDTEENLAADWTKAIEEETKSRDSQTADSDRETGEMAVTGDGGRRIASYLAAGVIALAAVVAIFGVYRMRNVREEEIQQETVIMADQEWKEDAGDLLENEIEYDSFDEMEADDPVSDASDHFTADAVSDPSEQTSAVIEPETSVTETTVPESAVSDVENTIEGEAPVLSFAESGLISWPIHGDVILNYSMDKTVYFATLDQYKYNPALIISSEVNSKVLAAASGEVTHIETTAETGKTMTVDIGDGYSLIYGQLKDIQFQEGDFVKEGDLIGFVGEPSKYYSVEGSNLYFEMDQDSSPVDPLDYLAG